MSEIREVPPAEEERTEEPKHTGTQAMLRSRLTETTTWTFLILLGIVAGFAALRFEQFATVFNFRNIADSYGSRSDSLARRFEKLRLQ